jgi:hypothetical protein
MHFVSNKSIRCRQAPDADFGKAEHEGLGAGVILLPRLLHQQQGVTLFKSTSCERAPILHLTSTRIVRIAGDKPLLENRNSAALLYLFPQFRQWLSHASHART